ncbi:MAG TPA: hypothetical protein VIC05_10450 [Solirubrobacteraceae bacterium]|jgi:hypothetical protein
MLALKVLALAFGIEGVTPMAREIITHNLRQERKRLGLSQEALGILFCCQRSELAQ